MNVHKPMAWILVALLGVSFTIASFGEPKLSQQEKKLIKKELVEKIAAHKIRGEFSTQLAKIDKLQAFPRAKSLLSKENLQKGLIIAMLRYEGKKVPLLIFAASLSPPVKQKTGVEYGVAFLKPPHKVVGVTVATVSQLQEKVTQPKITLEWRKNGGAYPVTFILKDGGLLLRCFIPSLE